MSRLFFLVLSSLFAGFIFPIIAIAACDDGRTPCSHKCSNSERPACKDSKGADGKPYCVTPAFCRDGRLNSCPSGFSTRPTKCTVEERVARGCQDTRGSGGNICVRFTR